AVRSTIDRGPAKPRRWSVVALILAIGWHNMKALLLVEDDGSMHDLLVHVLDERKCRMVSADNVGLAWELYQAREGERFALVVLDWRLDGHKLCQRIRSTPDGQIPFILAIAEEPTSTRGAEVNG